MEDNQSKRIIFFSAHPDDEIGSAGGLIIKTLKNGGAVKLVLCVDPAEPRMDVSADEERETRLKEMKAVAEKIGADFSYLSMPHFPELSYENILPCVREIRSFKPDIVVTLQEDDYHTEHSQVAKIVKRAIWHAGRSAFPEMGEAHKAEELWEAEGDRPMREPNHLEDITDVMGDKRNTFLIYGSQEKRKSLSDAFEGINRFRGVMYKKGDYAEAYKRTEIFYG